MGLAAAFNPRLSGVIIAALAVALGVQTLRLSGLTIAPKVGAFHLTLIDLKGWRGRALDAEAALAAVKAAQPKAQAAQAAVNHQPAAITADIARQADAQTPDYLRRVADAAAGRALPVGGLCGPKAPDGGPGGPGLPGTDHLAGGDDGKAGSPDMVSVARSDWEKLTREAALRVQLYQVGQEWIKEGVAKGE
ncbi:hypothetical protein [Novosphingobium humi]|uniref:hypothetical protein n=1 Tax=Novosphingobium humi TaxID=2282397 RepID=UPI0025B278B2|nr:hypothetical protein [Novosphingobium humi]WJS97838.1 hypothetical protein NYQ05_11910 [Novosphingobium humi]